MGLNPDFFDIVAPRRVDIITGIDGVSFGDAWPNRKLVTVEGLEIPCLGREDLIRNKSASARDKDLIDLKTLQSHGQSG